MSTKPKILYVCQEMMPYLPESEISAICRQLPQLIQERGADIRTFMPRYGSINERRNQLHEVIRLSGMNIVIDDTDHQLIIKVASIPNARLQVYFIDNDDYFMRKSTICDASGNYHIDNDERAMFFSRGVIETVTKLRWSPDVIHCHGWFSAFMPVYIKSLYKDDPLFRNARTVLSLYNDSFPGKLDRNLSHKLLMENFDQDKLSMVDDPSYDNLIKYVIEHLDGIVVAGDNINRELVDFAASRGVKIFEVKNPDNYVDEYYTFYDEIISNGN